MAFEEWLKQPTPVTFVHRPTLFRRGQEKCFLVGFINSLIIQNYIRQPYMLRWHVKCVYTAVVIWIPFELVVVPLLGKNKQSLWWEFEKKIFFWQSYLISFLSETLKRSDLMLKRFFNSSESLLERKRFRKQCFWQILFGIGKFN